MIGIFKRSLKDGDSFSFKKIMTLLIFGAIISVFIFLSNTPHSIQGSGIVASVNGNVVSLAEFNTALNNQERMYQQMGFNLTENDRRVMRQRMLESLVQQEVTYQTAEKIGVMVSAEEIRQRLFNDYPVFQNEGRFDKSMYFQILEANRLNPADFEHSLRKGKSADKMIGLFQAAGQPSAIEKRIEAQLMSEKLQFKYVKIDKKELSKMPAFNADANKVTAFLADSANVAKLQSDFKAREKEFSTEAEVKARHILVKFNAGDSKSEESALEKITKLKAEISKKGFEAVAKASSEDEGSKSKGGDLGFFPRGAMVPEFENYAFSGELKKVSEPIKSQYGYHLIEVLDKKAETKKSFDDVKSQLAKESVQQALINQWISDFEKLVNEKKWTEVESLLASAKMTWKNTEFVSLGEQSIPEFGSPTVSQVAFGLSEKSPRAESVLREGENLFLIQFSARKIDDSVKNSEAIANQGRGNDFYQKWSTQAEKAAVIVRNEALILGTSQQ